MPGWSLADVEALLAPSLAHLGYSIHSIERAGRGGQTLRIAIDKPDGFISIADCERVSRVAGPLLDQSGLIPGSYTLEVSSPGAERPLHTRPDFERFVGKRVNVRYRVGETEAMVEGLLATVDDEGVAVSGRRGEPTRVGWADLLAARLVAVP